MEAQDGREQKSRPCCLIAGVRDKNKSEFRANARCGWRMRLPAHRRAKQRGKGVFARRSFVPSSSRSYQTAFSTPFSLFDSCRPGHQTKSLTPTPPHRESDASSVFANQFIQAHATCDPLCSKSRLPSLRFSPHFSANRLREAS